MNSYIEYSQIKTNGMTPLVTTEPNYVLTYSSGDTKIGFPFLYFDNKLNDYDVHIKINHDNPDNDWITVYANDYVIINDIMIYSIEIMEQGQYIYQLMR